MSLPANVLLEARSHSSHQVVEIHDDMNQGIEEGEETGMATGSEADTRPEAHRQDCVVDQVKDGDLSSPFPQDKEECVEEVDEFRYVEPIACCNHSHGIRIRLRKVDWLTENVDGPLKPAAASQFVEDPSVKNDLKDVVDHKDTAKLIGGPVGHEAGPDDFDQVEIRHGEHRGW